MSTEDKATSGTTEYGHGPLRTYEITWANGHSERVQGHQVTNSATLGLFGHAGLPPRFTIHGMFPDGWRMVLTALEADVRTIRDVTEGEWVL